MAKVSLQEKFQASYPFKQEDNEGQTWQWAKDGAQRPRPVNGGRFSGSQPSHDQATPMNDPVPWVNEAAAGNDPPTWTDLREWVMKENGGMKLTTMGETDPTNSVDRKTLKDGFRLHGMAGTDDQYTGENMDHFYGEVKGDDDAGNSATGFVERNNYLDRL